MNQLDVIDNDLKSLQAETKKKYNTIKDVIIAIHFFIIIGC